MTTLALAFGGFARAFWFGVSSHRVWFSLNQFCGERKERKEKQNEDQKHAAFSKHTPAQLVSHANDTVFFLRGPSALEQPPLLPPSTHPKKMKLKKPNFFFDHDRIPANHTHVDILSAWPYCVMGYVEWITTNDEHTHARARAHTHTHTHTHTRATKNSSWTKLQISMIQFPDKNTKSIQSEIPLS